MPDTFVQEIVVSLSNDGRFTVYLINAQGASTYDVELFLRETDNMQFKVGVSTPHGDAEVAFSEAIKAVQKYLTKQTLQVVSVNSPCNASFLGKSGQTRVLQLHGIQTTPTVNGQ